MSKERLGNFIGQYKFDIVLILITLIVSILLMLNFTVLYINGSSMVPTYTDGNIVVIKKSKSIEVDDLIVFNSPKIWGETEEPYIKRVVALGGDLLEIDDSKVYVNNTLIRLSPKDCESADKVSLTIPENNYFVMGDNLSLSNDGFQQYCENKKDILVSEDRVIVFGKEFMKFGGIR